MKYNSALYFLRTDVQKFNRSTYSFAEAGRMLDQFKRKFPKLRAQVIKTYTEK